MFVAQGNAGFSMTFKNGYTVSVRWQPGTYTQHNDYSNADKFMDWWKQPTTEEHLETGWVSSTAEVAVIRQYNDSEKNEWYNPLTLKKGDPEGWLPTDEVAGILSNVQSIHIGLKDKITNLLPWTR